MNLLQSYKAQDQCHKLALQEVSWRGLQRVRSMEHGFGYVPGMSLTPMAMLTEEYISTVLGTHCLSGFLASLVLFH